MQHAIALVVLVVTVRIGGRFTHGPGDDQFLCGRHRQLTDRIGRVGRVDQVEIVAGNIHWVGIDHLPQANSYMINSETRKFDEQGQLTFVLNTNRGQYFKNQNKFVMDEPRMKANGNTSAQPPWRLSANTGVIFSHGERIVLRGKVHAWQQAPTGNTDLNTSLLTYYPDSNVAETKRKVTMTSPGTRITGVGMKADLEQQLFQLLAKVKSKHHATN